MLRYFVGIFIAGIFLASCDEASSGAQQNNTSDQTQCSQSIFVKMGDYTFKMRREVVNGMFLEGDMQKFKCDSSQDNPVLADSMSFSEKEVIPATKTDRSVGFQFSFTFSENTGISRLSKMEEMLQESGQSIKDLPKEGHFHKYVKTSGSTVYISDSAVLADLNGYPLVFSSSDPRCGFYAYSVGFEWKKNLYVSIRTPCYPSTSTLPKPENMDVWIQGFSHIMRVLESTEYTKEIHNNP